MNNVLLMSHKGSKLEIILDYSLVVLNVELQVTQSAVICTAFLPFIKKIDKEEWQFH